MPPFLHESSLNEYMPTAASSGEIGTGQTPFVVLGAAVTTTLAGLAITGAVVGGQGVAALLMEVTVPTSGVEVGAEVEAGSTIITNPGAGVAGAAVGAATGARVGAKMMSEY